MSDCSVNHTKNAPCACNDDYNANIPSDTKCSLINPRVIKVDFGEVQTGHQKSMQVPFRNDGNEDKTYVVKENPNTVPIYHFFKTATKGFTLERHKSTFIKVTYKPLLAAWHDFDILFINDEYGEQTQLEMTGISVGPMLTISTNVLRFNTWPGKTWTRKVIEIRNMSAFPVEFTFDVDSQIFQGDKHIFYIQPHWGVIDAHRHIMVYVIFWTSNVGEYSKRLFCMVHNSYPLSVECFGVHWCTKELVNSKRFVKRLEVCETNYDHYMFDVQGLYHNKNVLFTFIEPYLNFGTINGSQKEVTNMITTLSNHGDQSVLAKCYPDEVFRVTPSQVILPPNESVLFECSFHPQQSNKIYSRHLLFNILSSNHKENNTMPIPALLRVLGNTFTKTSFWVPQVHVHPTTLILPPILPGERCSTTLELRSVGHLPTSYLFVPPTASNYLVKPMMGTVMGLTIVVVQMTKTIMHKPSYHQEQWHLELNNNKQKRLPICFKAVIEYPSIMVGENNKITIKGVQVGSEEIITVPIRNTCQHKIFFEFIPNDISDKLKILNPKGEILPRASTTIQVSFKSSQRICKQVVNLCHVYAMRKLKAVYGKPVETSVTFIVEADYSELCSIPTKWNFGIVECNAPHTTNFALFNYGQTTIHYKLTVYSRHFTDDVKYHDTTMVVPEMGTLPPGANVECEINFHPHDTGEQYACVYYHLRTDATTNEAIENTQKLIFEFSAEVINPYFQIIEIADHNFGPLFTKRTLWESLNINWLNYALTEVQREDNVEPIDLHVPDAEMSDELFYVALVAKNVTPFPVRVLLKRRKLCDCELQEVGVALSIRRRVYQCQHREMCTLLPKEMVIMPGAMCVMSLEVRYLLAGSTTLSYTMEMNDHRVMILNFCLRTIPRDGVWLSRYQTSYSVFLHSVCMRLKHPTIHVFRFYNNTNMPISYELSQSNLGQINDIYRFQVWKCLNPTGIVDKFQSHPIFIRQQPLDKKSITLKIPITVNNSKVFTISIRGRGSRSSNLTNIPKLYLPRAVSPDVPVHLSTDRLRIRSFPVWSTATRMIFITNMSCDILGYNWIKADIPGLCSVEVMDPNRVLRPGQTDTLVVRVHSFDKACMTRVHLPCRFISHTKYLQHKKSVSDYKRRQEEIQEEFIITDKGITYPENDEIILPEPKHFYATIALDLEVTSFLDRDTLYPPREQLKHDVQGILIDDIETLPKRNKSEQVRKEPIYGEPANPYEYDQKTDNITFYQHVMESLLGDAIFSENFKQILTIQKRSAPIYYTQIKPRPDTPTDFHTHIKNMYNEPQMPIVKEVIHTMLLESFDEMFKLGAKHRQKIDYAKEVDLPDICHCHSIEEYLNE